MERQRTHPGKRFWKKEIRSWLKRGKTTSIPILPRSWLYPAEPLLDIVINGAAGALTLIDTGRVACTHKAMCNSLSDVTLLDTEIILAHYSCCHHTHSSFLERIIRCKWSCMGNRGPQATKEGFGGEGMWHMCLHCGTFLAGKSGRQTDFTAGNSTACQRCRVKMGYHTSLLVEKRGDTGTLGAFHTVTTWDVDGPLLPL